MNPGLCRWSFVAFLTEQLGAALEAVRVHVHEKEGFLCGARLRRLEGAFPERELNKERKPVLFQREFLPLELGSGGVRRNTLTVTRV